MSIPHFGRYAFSYCAAVAILVGCGGGGSALPAGLPNASRPLADDTYKSLYNFQGPPDGAAPYAGVIAVNGMLYGTTTSGGSGYSSSYTNGTVFTASPSGEESVLHSFGSGTDGELRPAHCSL
jgi:uncharacterized repeat protein (TIGR03803 family)